MEKECYQTKNLNLAAYLYASGLQLVGTKRINNEVFFCFESLDKADKLVNDYYQGTASINPRELFSRLNDLKDLIFSGGQYK